MYLIIGACQDFALLFANEIGFVNHQHEHTGMLLSVYCNTLNRLEIQETLSGSAHSI